MSRSGELEGSSFMYGAQGRAFDPTPTSNEVMSGVRPSAQHDVLLASYLLGLRHGPAVVRDLIVADLDGFLDLGLNRRAADQLVVLRAFLAKFPEAGRAS